MKYSFLLAIISFVFAVNGSATAKDSKAIDLSQIFSEVDDSDFVPMVHGDSSTESVLVSCYHGEGTLAKPVGSVNGFADAHYETTAFGPGNWLKNGCCNCCCNPRWTIVAGAMWLHRDRPNSQILMQDSFGPGANTLLNANLFRFDFPAGFELGAIRHNVMDSCWDLEARFFNVDGMNASTPTVLSPGGAVTPYVTPIGNTFFPVQFTGAYDSELLSTEINLRRQMGPEWLTVLAGFRYLKLDEEGMAVFGSVGPGLNNFRMQNNARNDLFGVQLGADVDLWSRGRFSLNTFGKAGLYANNSSSSVLVSQDVLPLFFCNAENTDAAFAGELGVVGLYKISRSWSLRAAYQLLWVEGVALASDQVATSDPLLGTANVSTDGTLYQGLSVGLQFVR